MSNQLTFIIHILYFMLSLLNRDSICDKWLLHCPFSCMSCMDFSKFSSDVRGKPSLTKWSLMEAKRVKLHFDCAVSHACAQHFWCDEIKSSLYSLLLNEIQIWSFTITFSLFSLFLTTLIFFYYTIHASQTFLITNLLPFKLISLPSAQCFINPLMSYFPFIFQCVYYIIHRLLNRRKYVLAI